MANPSLEKRRSRRVPEEFPIQVAGTDAKGKGFVAVSRTLLLSRHGAKILLENQLAPEQEINVYCPWTRQAGDARVVGLFDKQREGYSYGIEFLDQEVNLWGMAFE